jgi:hypothetical protein
MVTPCGSARQRRGNHAAMTLRLRRLAFAARVAAVAINIWSLFHGFTLSAAIFARSGAARTNGMRAFLSGFRGHFVLLVRICGD